MNSKLCYLSYSMEISRRGLLKKLNPFSKSESKEPPEAVQAKPVENNALLKIVNHLSKLEKTKPSRRDFLRLAMFGTAAASADQVLFGGTIREVFFRVLVDPSYRQAVLNKISQGELFTEFEQQVADRTIPAEVTVLGNEVQHREDWMNKFKELHLYELQGEQHQQKVIFIGEVAQVKPIIANPHTEGGIELYAEATEVLSEGSIVLPGQPLTSEASSNAYLPATYSWVRSAEGVLEFTDSLTGQRTPRDGTLRVDTEGGISIRTGDTSYEGLENCQALITLPFTIEIDLTSDAETLAKNVQEQLDRINNNESVRGSERITESLRYETFYAQLDNKVILLGISKTPNSKEWTFTERLSISQAIDILVQYALQTNVKKLIIVPTDPDINDGVFQVNGANWTEQSITHKGSDRLMRQAFYLTL